MDTKFRVFAPILFFAVSTFSTCASADSHFQCPFKAEDPRSGRKPSPLSKLESQEVDQIRTDLAQIQDSAAGQPEVDARANCLSHIANRLPLVTTSPTPSSEELNRQEQANPTFTKMNDPGFQTYLDSFSPFREENGNSIRLLDTGDQHWSELQNVIHNAGRFLNLSYLQFTTDEVGYALTEALIAKRLQMSRYLTNANLADLKNYSYVDANEVDFTETGADEKIVALFLQAPGTAHEITGHKALGFRPRNGTVESGMTDLLNWYVTERLKNEGLEPNKIAEVLSDPDEFNKNLNGFLSSGVEIRVLLDFLNVEIGNLFLNEPNALIGSLRRVGVQAHYAPNLLFWISDHFKIASSEHESVVSGGNAINKVMEVDPKQITFRDTAFAVQGPLVTDINQFFVTRFYTKGTLGARLASEGTSLYDYQPDSAHPFTPTVMQAQARLIDTVPFKSINTQRTLMAVLHNTKRSFVADMGFFSDPYVGALLSHKADELGLVNAKYNNGEYWKNSTCDPAVLAQRPHIVVIVPRYGDQLFSNISFKGIVSGLLKRGIDVCNWDGYNANQLPENADGNRVYTNRAMLHTKAWVADDAIAYLGSANFTHRSLWTDYELGMLTTDPVFIQNLSDKTINLDLKASVPSIYHWYNRLINGFSWMLNWGLWLD